MLGREDPSCENSVYRMQSINRVQTGSEVPSTPQSKPLLKWAGGKRKLLHHLAPLIPLTKGRYFEPFLGGGALFFSLTPKLATLSDTNSELIECYKSVKKDPGTVLAELSKLKNDEASYYKVRATSPSSPSARAARLLYLTTLSFNGIYRQNLAGEFNVPYGRKTHVNPAALPIHAASRALKHVNLKCCDFEAAAARAVNGDIIYFDPPYTVAHSNNGFVKYNAKIFSWADQERLAQLASELADRGCTVLISNADHPSIHALYPNFKVFTIHRQSVIAASSEHRKQTSECLFVRGGRRCS